jgi:hypothetical protein
MKGKIGLVVGGAIGYVLGTRAGRERYEQIVTQARSLWDNPRVQDAASRVPEQAQRAASTAASKAGSKHRDEGGTATPPETYPNADAPLGDLGP